MSALMPTDVEKNTCPAAASQTLGWRSTAKSGFQRKPKALSTFHSGRAGAPSVTTRSTSATASTNKSGIVSKYALTNPTFTAYTQKASETRGYEKTYITVNGKQIALFNTHMETIGSYAVHVAQMKQLFDDVQTENTFIAIGDFNAECHSTSDAEYTDTLKQWVDAGYNMVNWKATFTDSWFNGTTVAGSNYKCPCDNIITSQYINIVRWVYDPIKLEYESGAIDHIAVVAYLEVTSS